MVGIDPKDLKIQNKKTKDVTVVPYGICVWAAGIAPREITKTMIKNMPSQNNRSVIFVIDTGSVLLYVILYKIIELFRIH